MVQLFGQKSERRIIETSSVQGTLGLAFDERSDAPTMSRKQQINAYERRATKTTASADARDELPLFFDETKVPVEIVTLANPETTHLRPEDYEVIGEKVSYRLAQRPGSYVVLKYIRPVIKRRDTQMICCPPAPVGVIDGSRADVSFIAGLLVDKLAYHLPFYRQHQRLIDAGFTVSRPWLTQLACQASAMLEPIYPAQLNSIRHSRVLVMDETLIKAGRAEPGKLQTGYFWPIYGELDEICFPFFPNRHYEYVEAVLSQTLQAGTVLLSDGYGAYDRYAKQAGSIHAQCWSHCRRGFFKAQDVEPIDAGQALDRIGALYQIEARIREQTLNGDAKRDYRLTYAKPIVQQFFDWIDERFAGHGLLPKNPFLKALAYARERRAALEVYLTDPDVPIDTNHLERALRAIPMGRKAWLFAWTELGAKHIGIVQSLIVTCRLQGIDPYTYLVDVLQRISSHLQRLVEQLTPRLWKQHFAANPLHSDLDSIRNQTTVPPL